MVVVLRWVGRDLAHEDSVSGWVGLRMLVMVSSCSSVLLSCFTPSVVVPSRKYYVSNVQLMAFEGSTYNLTNLDSKVTIPYLNRDFRLILPI